VISINQGLIVLIAPHIDPQDAEQVVIGAAGALAIRELWPSPD
jgi:hypothetical protein